MRYIWVLFYLHCIFAAQAQMDTSTLAIGQWRSHLPLRTGRFVTQSSDKVYYATEQSVLEIDKADFSLREISRVHGLSNTKAKIVKYVGGSKSLLVLYDNSVIDLVPETGPVFTFNQINNFSNFVGDKIVHAITVEDSENVLICGNYGLSRLNLRRREFSFTAFTGLDVYSAVSFNGFLYAATEGGIYRVALTERNLQNFSNWQLLGPELGFPSSYESRAIAVFNNKLYCDLNRDLYRLDNERPSLLYQRAGFSIQYLSAEGKNLLVGYRCQSNCDRGALVAFDANGNRQEAPRLCMGVPNFASEDQSGRIWMGDEWQEIRVLNGLKDTGCRNYMFNSPFSDKVWEMALRDNELWLATGGVNRTFSYLNRSDGFASYIDGQWNVFTRFNGPFLRGENATDLSDDLTDVMTIAPHPSNQKVYIGSFYEGLLELEGDKFKLFNEKNSTLNNTVGDIARTRISGLAFDKDENLWIANHLAANPISVLTKAGEWQSFRPSCGVTSLHQVAVDASGYKWFCSSSNSAGLIVFDSGKLDNAADDRCRVFTTANSELQTNQVNCLAVDLDGDVWVGTGEGVVIFECGSNAFDLNCRGTRRVVEVIDGLGAYLLETEVVTTIAVDGANRKWVGTRNGVFVLSPSGRDQQAHFTTQNSPLLSNAILDIAINAQTGEVFIGTESGIIVLQSDAVQGGRIHNAELKVYPNPVRPDYDGPIAIRGLARDAAVKITDVAGNLVFETRALGGQAIWDGRDYQGRRVQSGIYLVFSSSNPREAGFGKPSTATGKIVVLHDGGK
jgi:ligand-binding sensor domain-containing protein